MSKTSARQSRQKPSGLTLLSYNAATCFHLLLEASLTPSQSLAKHHELPPLETDETADALSQRALLWNQLLYEWAAENGQIPLAVLASPATGEPLTLYPEGGFYDAIAEIQSHIDLEFSLPLRPIGNQGPTFWPIDSLPTMKPFAGQRLSLVDRTDWTPIDFNCDDDSTPLTTDQEDSTPNANLPIMGEPSLSLGSAGAVGQVWIRISTSSLKRLNQDLPSSILLLATLAETRADLLRHVIHTQQPSLTIDQAKITNGHLDGVIKWADLLRVAVDEIRRHKSQREQNKRAKRVLQIINKPDELRMSTARESRTVLLSYSHRDTRHKDAIESHLALLKREGLISIFHDGVIPAGASLHEEINKAVWDADIIIALLSSDYLASDYCYNKELHTALDRHKRGTVQIIPVVLRPCDWLTSPLRNIKALPHDGEPVEEYRNADRAYLEVAQAVRAAISKLNATTTASRPNSP